MNSTTNVATDEPYEIVIDGTHIAIDTTPVRNRGEELHETIWQGRQWAVTEYGIEARDGKYALPAERLSEAREHSGHQLPDWPLHMAEKIWVDIHDFYTAFLVALACYPRFAKFNETQIREGVRRAITASARYR